MRIHYLQHVPFEGIGAIAEWAAQRGHTVTGTALFDEAGAERGAPEFPGPDDFDLLVVMGGPMSVHDDRDHPWLPAERAFIGNVIAGGGRVLGICLGAQLIAAALGAGVTRARHKEIGWYPVDMTTDGRKLPVFTGFPEWFTALHWHGDTFALPGESVWVASSTACPHQAFALDKGRVVGLQFHLEETPESLALLVEHAGHELADAAAAGSGSGASGGVPAPAQAAGRWIATREQILSPAAPYAACRELLFGLLDRMLML
jgi:GMP synthase-like glutamine amidotransferase